MSTKGYVRKQKQIAAIFVINLGKKKNLMIEAAQHFLQEHERAFDVILLYVELTQMDRVV